MSEAATILTPAPTAAAPAAAPPAAAATPPAAAVPAAAPVDPATPAAQAPAPANPASADADWRKVLAGEDAETLKALERFATPGDYHKSFTEAQKTIRAKQEGVIKLPGDKATDEEKAAFAKALGIPEAPDKYERAKPPEGLELSEADQDFISTAIKELHAEGGFAAHPEVVKKMETFYHRAMQVQAATMAAAAVQKKNEGKAILSKLYGQNLALEMKHAENAVAAFGPRDPAKMRGFLDRQFADGTTVGDDPEFVQLLVRASRATHEDPFLLDTLGGGLPSDLGAVQQQIDDILKLKGTPAFDAKDKEFKALLAQRERLSGKG